MPGMVSPLVIVAALAVFAALFPAYAVNGLNIVSRQESKCTSVGQRCAGEEGKPFIEFFECCDKTNWCMKKPNATAEEWGMYCLPAASLHGCRKFPLHSVSKMLQGYR
jgi:hypothetical protein